MRDCGKWVSTSQIGTEEREREPCQVSHGRRQCGVAPIVSQQAGFGTLHGGDAAPLREAVLWFASNGKTKRRRTMTFCNSMMPKCGGVSTVGGH